MFDNLGTKHHKNLWFPSHFPPQRVGAEFHAAEGEPFLAQVLQRGTDMIHRVVEAVCSKMELTESPCRMGDRGSSPR